MDGFQETIFYVKRQEYELLLLNYIKEEFTVIEDKFNEFTKKTNAKKIKQKNKEDLGKVKDET